MGEMIIWLLIAVIALLIVIVIRQQKALKDIEAKLKKMEAWTLTNAKALQSTMKVVSYNLAQEIKREEDAKEQDTQEKQ